MSSSDQIENIDKTPRSLINLLLSLTIVVHLISNLFGLPLVKFSYLFFVVFLILQIITSDSKKIIFPFIIFSLFEGQGRVIWGYSAWARIIFDILMVFIIVKNAIRNKKLLAWGKLPNTLSILFILHFLWFFIELFNPSGAGLLPSFATSKFYIFPILLFFYFLDIPLSSKDVFFQRNVLSFIFVIIALSIIVIIQDSNQEAFMEQMSSHYTNLFEKYKIFQDYAFRPWGTSFVPGGMGTLFFGTVGFILLFKPKVLVQKPAPVLLLHFIKYICLSSMFYCLFIGEVRSATIKFVGIVAFVELWNFFKGGKKFKKIIGLISIVIISMFSSNYLSNSDLLSDLNYEKEIGRWTELEKEGVGSQRSGFWKITDAIQQKVNFPLGFGLGMTTNFLPAFQARRKMDVQTPMHHYWNMDNLFMFLLLELGIGALFYGGAIIFIFVSSLSKLMYAFKHVEKDVFRDISVAAGTIFFIFIGNWGAVGIPYNPESFFFWFWVAVLYNMISRTKESSKAA